MFLKPENLLCVMANNEYSVEASVFAVADGRFAVEVRDIGNASSAQRIFPKQADAEEYAAKCVK